MRFPQNYNIYSSPYQKFEHKDESKVQRKHHLVHWFQLIVHFLRLLELEVKSFGYSKVRGPI